MEIYDKRELKNDAIRVYRAMGGFRNNGKRKRHIKMLEKTIQNPEKLSSFIRCVMEYGPENLRIHREMW